MNRKITNTILYSCVVIVSLFASTFAQAWHGGHSRVWIEGNRHYHNDRGWGYGPGPYYEGGYYGGWNGPNIVINVPSAPQYVPECQTVEECNSYGECWLQRYCD